MFNKNYKINSKLIKKLHTVYKRIEETDTATSSIIKELMINFIIDVTTDTEKTILLLSTAYPYNYTHDKIINFNIEEDFLKEFEAHCTSIGTKPIDCIRKLIMLYILKKK